MTASSKSNLPLWLGLAGGGLNAGWIAVMGLSTWAFDPQRFQLFWVGMAIHVAVVVLSIGWTRQGRNYRARLGVGLATTAVAAVVVFVGWLFFVGLVMPDYFVRLRAAQEQSLALEGLGAAEVDKRLQKTGASRTPGGAAFAGFMGILGIGFIGSLVAAAAIRDPSKLRHAVSIESRQTPASSV